MNEEPQVPQQTEDQNQMPQQDMPTPPQEGGEGQTPTPEAPAEGAPQEDDQQTPGVQ